MERKRPFRAVNRRHAIAWTVMLCGLLAGCQDSVEFTRRPVEKVQSGEQPSIRAPIFVVARMDAMPLKTQAEGRIPERIIRVRRRLPKAACVEKNGRTRCVSARVTGDVVRQGGAVIAGAPDGFALKIPMAYALKVKGSGIAGDVEEMVRGNFVVTANFRISLGETWAATVRYRNDLDASAADDLKILRGNIDLAKSIARKLRNPLSRLAKSFERSIDAAAASKIVDATWRYLHYPVALQESPPLWLRGEPQKVAFGGIGVLDESLELRVAILTDVKTYSGERPVPLIARAMPPLDLRPLDVPASHLVMPVDLAYDEIAGRIRGALDKRGVIRPPENAKASSFTVKSVKLYPAGGRLAVAVQLEAEMLDRWQNLTGTAYVLGTPHVEAGQAHLGLKLVEFSAPTQSPALFDNGKFVLPETPFVEALREGIRINLKDRFASVLMQANQIAQSDFAKGNQMRGRFDDLSVHSIETMETGLRINLDLIGALSVYPGAGKVASGLGKVEPSSSEQ